MESVFYNHTNEDAALRRADLRQALLAFLTDTASCAAVHVVGLFVRVPTPSTLTVMMSSSSETSKVDVADVVSASPSPSLPRQRQAQKLAWCALEAGRRLRQAAGDAAELNRWLVHGALSNVEPQPPTHERKTLHGGRASSSASSTFRSGLSASAKVVVVAYLEPQTRADIAVYESWQRCAEACTTTAAAAASSTSGAAQTSRTTRRLSPLHEAAFVAVSFGAPSLLLSWCERPSRCFLSNLLLPHQSLLVDLTWCIEASLISSVEVKDIGAARRLASAGQGRVTGQVLLDLFAQDVLPSLKLPKGDSQAAFWISYTSLMAALHPHVFPGDGGGADLSLAAHTRPAERRGGNVDAEAFSKTHRLVRQLFTTLFQGSPTGTCRTQAVRVLLGYGGSVSSLKRQLIYVPTCGTALLCSGGACGFAASSADAALLRTRSLVDMHALLGVLMGYDRIDFYAAAAGFVRTAMRRAAATATAASAATALHALESTLVHVDAADRTRTSAVTSAALHGTRNAFVEVGARALAKKRARLERRRLGKGKTHLLRPRDRAARARKHKRERMARQVAMRQNSATSASLLADGGLKCCSGQAGGDEDVVSRNPTPATQATAAGAIVATDTVSRSKKKKVKGEAPIVSAAIQHNVVAGEALSWSVDLG